MATMTGTGAVGQYVLRSVDIDRDAEKLAEMWNASDDQWPGTWTKGVPFTAQRVRDWYAREKSIDALIWDTGDAIAGYCSLWERPGEENVTYIATLNVAPAFQTYSLGRKFLTHYVERVVELGSVRLDLNTWSGNLKAMPLYKKCGFFWVPGTSVAMQNYLPAILSMPCTQSFFEKHDWYRTFKRELAQAEDDERWEGMKVFTYRFAEDGDSLTVWVDREARKVTAVETGDFFAAAIAPDNEPPRGLPAALQWKLANKRDEAMQVSLIATGSQGLKLNHRAALRLAPGESATLEARVEVSADAPDVKADKPAPAVTSLLIVDGEVVELGTGLRPRAAVEVSTYPEYITLLPGVPQTVPIQLRSRLKQAVEATVSIAPQEGLATDWTQQQVSLAAEGYAGLPVALQASTGGVFELPVSITFDLDGSAVHLPVKTQAVFALPLGGVLGAHDDGKLRIENETARLIVAKEGGALNIYDRPSGQWLAWQTGYAAPPAWPSEYGSGEFELGLERDAEQVVAVASMASQQHPGFVLRKRISVNSSPVFRIDYDFENLGTEGRTFQLFQLVGGDDSVAALTLPLHAGLGRGVWADFPGTRDDEFRKAGAYAERWSARESAHATVGLIWAGDVEDIEWAMVSRLYDCPPQSRVRPGPLHIYVGEGDWRTVRRLWQRLAGQPLTPREATPEPRAPLAARIEPAVVVAADCSARAALLVEHLRSRKCSGKATLHLPPGWTADLAELDLVDVAWRQPYRAEVRFTATGRPGAATGRIEVRSAELDADFDVPLIRLGDGGPVEVREGDHAGQRVLTILNGRLELDVTPGFSAAVSALRENGVNHLASPFPHAGTFGWMSPWYGGIMPILMPPGKENFPGSLWQERFDAEAVASVDGQGIEWRGVRQRAVLQAEDLRGLALEIDTLVVGGSPLVKQVLRLINTTSVVRRVEQAGWVVFVQPDGSRSRTTVWGPEQQFKHRDHITWARTGHWVAAENPETGRALALISPSPRAGLSGWGSEGGHLELQNGSTTVPALGSTELVAYLVLADTIESARHFAALRHLL